MCGCTARAISLFAALSASGSRDRDRWKEGGSGGGGGGIIVLAAGGQLAIGAEINADGFAGGPDDAGAGGGGGSGGVILLRGAGDIDVTMKPGLNEVCIHVVDDANAALPEAKSCTPIAYIPEWLFV